MTDEKNIEQRFAICVENEGYVASLELNKIYRTQPDDNAVELGLVRIVDESGEDYLYPQEYFAILPKDAFCSMHFSQDERSKILHSLMSA